MSSDPNGTVAWVNGRALQSNVTYCVPLPPQNSRRILQDAGYVLPTWQEFFDMYLWWPIIFQLLVTVLFIPLSAIYARLYVRKGYAFRTFIDNFVGTVEKPQVAYPVLVVLCYILQLVFSMASVAIFIVRTYSKEVTPFTRVLEMVFSIFFLLHYFLLRMQAGFRPGSAWILGAFIDNLTMIPVLFGRDRNGVAIDVEKTWLSLKFLRAYRALLAYQRLEKTVDLKSVSEFSRKLLLSFLRTMALVICYSGTIMVLEILGELPGWEDEEFAIETNMGNLTFIQMFYWMVTTISTVGYGDFSPTTVPGRIMICGFIVGGIIFFGNETSTLGEISKTDGLGKGSYVKHNRHAKHVVVVGSGCNKASSQMTTFLEEILDSEEGLDRPNVVLLSENSFDEELIAWAASSLPKKARLNIHFLIGSSLSKNDLVRCKLSECRMAFIIPDTTVSDCDFEDGQNMLRAIEMKRFHPKIKLRLMLLQPESKTRAVTIGIKRERCFSAHEIKANLMVQSLRCKGFMTMVSGLLQTVSEFEIREIQEHTKKIDKEWMEEYLWGLQWSVCGMVLSDEFVGMTFAKACSAIFQKSEGAVLLLGVQFRGNLRINLDGDIEENMVAISISQNHEELKPFAKPSKDWRVELVKSRQAKYDNVVGAVDPSIAAIHSQTSRLDMLQAKESSFQLEGTKRHRSGFNSAYYSHSSSTVGPRTEEIAANVNYDDSAMTEEEARAEEQEAEQFRKNPDLVTLLIIGETSWQQVVAFLRTLRQPHLPKRQPVIVLSTMIPPEDIVKAFEKERVAFLTGPLMRITNLIEAGIAEAQSIVVMRGDQGSKCDSSRDAILADHETVLLASMIEQILADSTRDQFAIEEFETTEGVHSVEHQSKEMKLQATTGTVSGSHLGSSSFMDDEQSFGGLGHSASTLNPGLRTRHSVKQAFQSIKDAFRAVYGVLKQLFTKGMDEGDEGVVAAVQGQLIFHPRFAAGQAFTPDFFGGLLGHIYHFPAAVEFTEAVTMPGRRDQTSYPWQILVPSEWVGKTYGEIAKSWMVPLDPKLQECGPTIIMAIYRRKQMADSPVDNSGYNVTLPHLSTTLRQDDLLTVLSSKKFGKTMADRKLLRGAMADSEVCSPKETEQKKQKKQQQGQNQKQKQQQNQQQQDQVLQQLHDQIQQLVQLQTKVPL